MKRFLKSSDPLFQSMVHPIGKRFDQGIFVKSYENQVKHIELYGPEVAKDCAGVGIIKDWSSHYEFVKQECSVEISESFNLLHDEKRFFDYYFMLANPLSALIKNLHKTKNRPIIFGLQAHQGCGKTTLSKFLTCVLKDVYNLKCITVSMDDFYLTQSELTSLKLKNNNYKFRGPPGTHDILLIREFLDKIESKQKSFYLTKFDKCLHNGQGDRVTEKLPENLVESPIDILIFEGWFNGIMPVANQDLISNLQKENIDKQQFESKLQFQLEINELLKSNYTSIWKKFDSLLVIKPEEYYYSKDWKKIAEKKKGRMSPVEVDDFVNYFWDSVPPMVYFENLIKQDKSFNYDTKHLYCDIRRNYYI